MTTYSTVDAIATVEATAVVVTPELSIDGPITMPEDTTGVFWGVLTGGFSMNWAPLSGQPIEVYLDGVYLGTAITDVNGVWEYGVHIDHPGLHEVRAHFPGATVLD